MNPLVALANACAVCVAAVLWTACARPEPPSLVLITLDTTRHDHLGPYGYASAVTPQLDRFAETATVYERAYATSSWTLPSHASLLTGLLPMQHGAQTAPGAPAGRLGYGVRALHGRFTTLAERLKQAGYRTGAVVAGPALGREFGLAQGFEIYADALDGPGERFAGKRAARVADQAIRVIERFGTEPFFLFVNFFDPHAPYRPPPPYDAGLPELDDAEVRRALLGRLVSGVNAEAAAADASDAARARERRLAASLDAIRAGYDAEISYMDQHLGRLLAAIAASPAGRGALIAVTADHGESFGEHHYMSHGAHLYEDNVRVPLIVRHPGRRAGVRVPEPVQNHLLFGTLLGAAGVSIPDGVPPLALAEADAPIVLEVGRSDANVRLFGEFFDRDLRAVVDGRHKWIETSTGARELYDLEADAQELRNLADAETQLAGAFERRLEQISRANPPLYDAAARADVSPETEEALRALGYLD